MDGSRDDFIIAIRSAFLKRETQQTFSLLGLIIFSLILLILGSLNFKIINYIKIIVNEGVYRSSLVISIPEKFIKKTYINTNEHFKFYDEYKKNKVELKNLRSKNLLNEFAILENNRLKSIIDDYLVISNEIVAKILIDKQSPFSRSVIANKGSKNNIKRGMVVLDGEYLVGKVIEVNYITSRILLLSDFNSKIPVTIEPGGTQSILSGTGKDDAIIEYIKDDYIDNDTYNATVYTSGFGGLFKAGIPIGKIKNIDLNKEIKVSFFSDFTQLSFVKILSYEEAKTKAKEKIKLEAQKESKIIAEKLKKIQAEVELKAQKIKKLKAEEENKLKAEEEIKLKAEEEIKLKAEGVSRLKAEENLALNIEKQKNYKDLELKYSSQCKKRFFNMFYKIGTPEYKNCILNKGIKTFNE
jgi:rod shape-determining protein MreC